MRKAKPASDDMKPEYDFAGAVRGRFYRKDAELVAPVEADVHLEPDVLRFLQARAAARGKSVSQLANELLKKDIELIEMAGLTALPQKSAAR